MTAQQEPIRVDHITTQYIWALENEFAFVTKARQFAERGQFSHFRARVERHIDRIKSGDSFHIEEWAFLFLELWHRMGGRMPDMSWEVYEAEQFRLRMSRLETVGYSYTPFGIQHPRPPATNPCAEIDLGQLQPCTLINPEPIQEQPVSNQIIIKNITFINNADVTLMSDDQLIDAIKKVEKEVEDLKSVKTKSEKIKAKIEEANKTLATLVSLLDAR